MLNQLLDSSGFSFDVETTSESGKKKDNLHFKKNEVICVAFANDEVSFSLTTTEIKAQWQIFKELMTNPEYKKVGHNLKFDVKCITGTFNIEVKGLWFDTHIASCLLNENEPHGLKALCKKYLKEEWGEFTDYVSWLKLKEPELKPKEIKHLASEKFNYLLYYTELKEYNRLDALNTWKLGQFQKPKLTQQKLWDLFKIEMEVLDVFYRSETIGVHIELDYLNRLSKTYGRYLERIVNWIYNHTQEEFNINSGQQLAHVLYDLKKFPILKRSEKGAPSTGAKTLKKLSQDGFRFVDSIVLYKHWEMLKRHVDKLIKENIDGKIYPTFNTVGTETGRFSCKEPNLQQIPSKTRESLAIRKGFTGNLLVADYSNVELRLLAHYSRDPRLLEVYKPGGSGDLHAQTAELLGVTRPHAKTINFGIGYGMGPRKLAEDLQISEEQAKDYIDRWYTTYSRVQPWKDMIINTCKKYGFVRSIGGRKRRIDFNKLAYNEHWGAEREVVNFVIQGSSADITKMAISALKDEKILMQVHDELVIDMEGSGRTLEEIKAIMENVVQLQVPLIADAKLCKNWSEGK